MEDGYGAVARIYGRDAPLGNLDQATHDARTQARAALVSAAPDLLAACKAAEASIHRGANQADDAISDRLRAAIAKARGA